jgi:hypothetical protein
MPENNMLDLKDIYKKKKARRALFVNYCDSGCKKTLRIILPETF